jgi:small subunit ribosomal protein S1
VWEKQYADAQARWEAHKAQVAHMNSIVIEPVERANAEDTEVPMSVVEDSVGTLADDEGLSALRDKLVDEE